MSEKSEKKPKLTREWCVVELADGRLLTVRILNPDNIRYEMTAQREKWPGMVMGEDGEMSVNGQARKTTFTAWAALKRTNQYDGTWEKFLSTDCVDVTTTQEHVDPTQSAPASDSAPSSPGMDDDPSPSSPPLTTSSSSPS